MSKLLITIGAAAAAVVFCYGAAVADDYYGEPRTSVSFYGGMSSPTGSLTDYHSLGYSVGGGFGYQLNQHLAIDIMSVGYDRFPLDGNQLRSEIGFDVSGASISMLSLMGGLRYSFIPQGFTPYVGFNAGLVHASIDDLTISDGSTAQDFYGTSENALGISLGGGVEGMVSERASAFTELRFTTAFTDGESSTYIPLRAGMRMHF